ncbi:uncharacterized protein LOC108089329 [Drosophila ficusphila]|uniref:uncharacterized protein LOC108089329 n=1 Tax=Drosophila ficusphila TaxID=30025 RepID=UPI0007E6508B|nr:uncharacterized protein LOC108089329 [Drosophila ficusphila]
MQNILIILIIVSCGLVVVEPLNCQECLSDNDVYCVDQTSYKYCMNNNPFGNVVSCPTGTVCTNANAICVESSDLSDTVEDVCGNSADGGCATCTEMYTCVSKNQFVRCSGSTLIDSYVFDCDSDEICNLKAFKDYGNICVPSCVVDFLDIKASCSNSEYTTTTTAAPATTTPSVEDEKSACSEAATDNSIPATTKYFFTIYKSDKTCHTYLYCQRNADTEWKTVFFSCPSTEPYYDSAKNTCVATKPTGCT